MLVKAIDSKLRFQAKIKHKQISWRFDYWLLSAAGTLLLLGLVMVASASASIADRNIGNVFYFVWRQCLYVLLGITAAWYVLQAKIAFWEKCNPLLLFIGVILLVVVIAVGREVNGSVRWLSFGIFNVQPSELVKLFMVMYMAGYLVRHGEEVRKTFKGFFKPVIVISVISILLLLEPDFGATAVLSMTTLGMLFVAGMRIRQFVTLLGVMASGFMVLALTAPYRVERLKSFLNPWDDPFDTGF